MAVLVGFSPTSPALIGSPLNVKLQHNLDDPKGLEPLNLTVSPSKGDALANSARGQFVVSKGVEPLLFSFRGSCVAITLRDNIMIIGC